MSRKDREARATLSLEGDTGGSQTLATAAIPASLTAAPTKAHRDGGGVARVHYVKNTQLRHVCTENEDVQIARLHHHVSH
jgi:hypothetical protein